MKNVIKKTYENLVWWVGVVSVGIIFGITLQFASAWVNPPTPPPTGNVGAPINTGPRGQIKEGNLALNSLGEYYYGLIVNGVAKVTGLQITTNPGEGKVLTSDNNGNGTWQDAGFSGGTIQAMWSVKSRGCLDGWTDTGLSDCDVNDGHKVQEEECNDDYIETILCLRIVPQ